MILFKFDSYIFTAGQVRLKLRLTYIVRIWDQYRRYFLVIFYV
jgi:hypothetical protein